MKICDEKLSSVLNLKDLKPGDVFKWSGATYEEAIKLRLDGGWTTISCLYQFSGSLDDSKVIRYPNACITLGDSE